MKIFILIKESDHYINLFVPELCSRLVQMGNHVSIGTSLFWQDDVFEFDVVHIHWPEHIFKEKVDEYKINLLRNRLIDIKSKNIPIIVQCHNLEPHNGDPIKIELYHVVYGLATAIVHMGLYSKNMLMKKYPGATHVIIPHHIYDYTHHFTYDQETCRKEVNFPSDKINILCFGMVRNDEEREMILKLHTLLKPNNINLITPGFFRVKLISGTFFNTCRNIFQLIQYKLTGMSFSRKPIDENLMEKYFTASDLVFIGRKKILNSGNLPFAFACGKIVVGPDTGNVGLILRECGNPVFQVDDENSIIKAINTGIELMKQGVGKQNKITAINKWSSELIAKEIAKLYIRLKNEISL